MEVGELGDHGPCVRRLAGAENNTVRESVTPPHLRMEAPTAPET